jgi:N-acetylmuramoyl-L-alanine amidase
MALLRNCSKMALFWALKAKPFSPTAPDHYHMTGVISPRRALSLIIVLLAFAQGLLAQTDGGSYRMKTVVIDAGHGGQDPGNLGTGRYKKKEKDISLDVALRLGNFIKESYPKLKVIYTRDSDVFIGLNERADVANKADADLFISIHCNAAKNTEAAGVETFTLGLHKNDENLQVAMKENQAIFLEDDYQTKYEGFDPNSPESIIALTIMQSAFLEQSLKISSYIQKQFKEKVDRKDRGVKQAGFLVLRRTTMPSILIELGFLTNKDEEDFLNSENGRLVMASAIFRGFKDYKERVEGGTASTTEKEVKQPAPVAEEQKPAMKPSPPAEVVKPVQETKPAPSKADVDKTKAEQELQRKQKELEAMKSEKERLEKIKKEQEAAAQQKADQEAQKKAEAERLAKEKANMEKELEAAKLKAEEKAKSEQVERVHREAIADQARVEFAERLAEREKAKQDSTLKVHAEQRERKQRELQGIKENTVTETKAVVPELADKPLTPEEAELLFLEKRKQELEDRITKIKGAVQDSAQARKDQPQPTKATDTRTEKPAPKEKPAVESKQTPAATGVNKGVILSVQILTHPSALDVNSAQFRGEKARQYVQDGVYKYVVGELKDFQQASALQTRLRKAGFEGAFLVAFKDGVRITVQEARELFNQ